MYGFLCMIVTEVRNVTSVIFLINYDSPCDRQNVIYLLTVIFINSIYFMYARLYCQTVRNLSIIHVYFCCAFLTNLLWIEKLSSKQKKCNRLGYLFLIRIINSSSLVVCVRCSIIEEQNNMPNTFALKKRKFITICNIFSFSFIYSNLFVWL
jgi:hypothetical protein